MEDTLLEILEAGFGAHQKGDLDQAIAHYRAALARDPGNADALHLFGLAMMQKGDAAAAATLIAQSLESDPDNPQALDHLGLLLTDLNKLKDAIAAFETALEKAPGFAGCWFNLGKARELARDFNGAIAAFEKAADIEPDYAHVRLGITHIKRGSFSDALASFDEALAIDPQIRRALLGRGDALRGLGRTEEAIEAYESCLAFDSRNGTIQSLIALCHSEAAQYGMALERYEDALSVNPDNFDATIGAGICAIKQGRFDQALAVLEKAQELAPGHPRVLAYKALLFNLLGRTDDAQALVDFDRDIAVRRLPLPPAYRDRRGFNTELAETLRKNPTLQRNPVAKSTRGGMQTGALQVLADAPVSAFNQALDAFIGDYLKGLTPRPGHPHFATIPSDYRIESWATILESGGHQMPHIHPDAWLSGVYYVAVPPEVDAEDKRHAGWIEFGAPGYDLPGRDDLVHPIAPHEGDVILFPSYFFHRTLPFEAETQRISIAFDVIATGV
jgi:tetratricopeptide (TPR) repeat protein